MLRLRYVENSNPKSMIKKVSQASLLMLVAGLLLSLVSCNPSAKYEKEEKQAIADYLASNPQYDFTHEASGLYYFETVTGTGASPATHDTAYVIYTAKFLNGTAFDSNVGKAALPFPVGEGYAIAGFDEGVSYMKEGGKAIFVIPSNLGYGSTGQYTIPGYTPLLYEVELSKVVPTAK
jgi:FKBP-type peptidyl-prolyl cis-trans isomerase